MLEGWVVNWIKKNWWRTNTERPENVALSHGATSDGACWDV